MKRAKVLSSLLPFPPQTSGSVEIWGISWRASRTTNNRGLGIRKLFQRVIQHPDDYNMLAVVSLHETRGGSHPRHHLLEQRTTREPSSCSQMVHNSSEKKHSCAGKIFNGPGGGITYQRPLPMSWCLFGDITRICPCSSRPGHDHGQLPVPSHPF